MRQIRWEWEENEYFWERDLEWELLGYFGTGIRKPFTQTSTLYSRSDKLGTAVNVKQAVQTAERMISARYDGILYKIVLHRYEVSEV